MLNKLSPFFAILFSIFLLREKPNLVQVLGVLVAFGGSVCIIKPSFDNPQMLPALAGVHGGLAGAFACVGQLGITKAYVCAPAKEISVYDYTQVLFAAALGFFVFGEAPDWLSVLGYVLICGAGVGMFLYNRRHDAAHP